MSAPRAAGMHEARLRAALRMHGSHRCKASFLLAFCGLERGQNRLSRGARWS